MLLSRELNDLTLSWEERQHRLAQFLNGERPLNRVGAKAVSAEEGRAAGWTPAQTAEINRMAKITPAYFKKPAVAP
jgi:hypothetical protein